MWPWIRPSKALHSLPGVGEMETGPPPVKAACAVDSRYIPYSSLGDAGSSTLCWTTFMVSSVIDHADSGHHDGRRPPKRSPRHRKRAVPGVARLDRNRELLYRCSYAVCFHRGRAQITAPIVFRSPLPVLSIHDQVNAT